MLKTGLQTLAEQIGALNPRAPQADVAKQASTRWNADCDALKRRAHVITEEVEVPAGVMLADLNDLQAVCLALCWSEQETAVLRRRVEEESAAKCTQVAATERARAELAERTNKLREAARAQDESRIQGRIDLAVGLTRQRDAETIKDLRAALAERDREIAELKANKKRLREALERAKDGR